MRLQLKRLTRFVFRRLGYQPIRMDTGFRSYNLEPLLQALKRFGFAPAHIIDVGANKGDWTRNAIKFFPDAHYTLMEPQDNLKTHIEDLIEAGHKIREINAGDG